MRLLFAGKSASNKGTLAHLRNAFNHRNVTTDVMNSFNYVEHFIRFVTDAHVVCLTMDVCGMNEMNDVPSGSPVSSEEDKRDFFDDVCSRVVEKVRCMRQMMKRHQIPGACAEQVIIKRNINWYCHTNV